MADHRDTLILPFEKGLLLPPNENTKWTLLNASLLSAQEISWASLLNCEQGFRSDFLSLQHAGYEVAPVLPKLEGQDCILVLANRTRKVNERNLIRAWNGLKQGGIVVFAGAKTSGVQALRKWAGKRTEISGSLSKHHGVVFWLVRKGSDWEFEQPGKLQDGYKVSPGMFSAAGSGQGITPIGRAIFLTGKLAGRVADYGAGWGYLISGITESTTRH